MRRTLHWEGFGRIGRVTAVLPWQRVLVHGPSMAPTLRHNDVLLVRFGARVRPGDVVLARFADMPDRYVVKRAVRPQAGGWWLSSDNIAAGGDSRVHGVAEVVARVVLCWPRSTPGLRAFLPRRIGPTALGATGAAPPGN
jgi:phage repressor protein C with HTH and peptisase S24 domain